MIEFIEVEKIHPHKDMDGTHELFLRLEDESSEE